MKLGFSLPQLGSHVSPEGVREVAQRGEEMGYYSAWVFERLLWPLEPQTPYDSTPDGSWPDEYRIVYDPIETLTFATAHTSTIKVGTGVMILPYHQPVMLGRRLATLDVLSGGRLLCGVGIGYSRDEFDTSGVPYEKRGKRSDEFLQALIAIWGDDPVEFHGEYYHIPKAFIGPKPVQKPRPPIYWGGGGLKNLRRAVTSGDGWHPSGFTSFDALSKDISTLQGMWQEAGRDLGSLEVILWYIPIVTESPLGTDRAPLTGSLDQIKNDAQRLAQMGVTQLVIDFRFTPEDAPIPAMLRRLEQLRSIV